MKRFQKGAAFPGLVKKILAVFLAVVFFTGITVYSPQEVFADTHREFEYDISTPWTPDDVQEMLDYATFWVGKISYASSQNGTDPDNRRSRELYDGGATDCSWFVFHVLFRYGLLKHFVHSYEWGNSPDCYPGGRNIGTDMSKAVAGDVLCTGTGTKPQNSHVLIYLGDNKVVECASGKGGVVTGKAPGHVRQIVHFDCIPRSNAAKTVETD